MPGEFGFKEQLMHTLSELPPVDNALKKRAGEQMAKTEIEKHLKPGGRYLDVGTGKGHIVEKMLKDKDDEGEPLAGYFSIDVGDKPLNRVQKREGKRQDKTYSRDSQKNPMGFSWARAEALPFASKSLDGVSFFFSINEMDQETIDKSIEEAKRALKDDGKIFITEDLGDNEEQKQVATKASQRQNWEDKDKPHTQKSDSEWEEYFAGKGLEVAEKKFFDSQQKEGVVHHVFYVLKLKTPTEN